LLVLRRVLTVRKKGGGGRKNARKHMGTEKRGARTGKASCLKAIARKKKIDPWESDLNRGHKPYRSNRQCTFFSKCVRAQKKVLT